MSKPSTKVDPKDRFYYVVLHHTDNVKLFKTKEDALMASKLRGGLVREVRLRDSYLDTVSP